MYKTVRIKRDKAGFCQIFVDGVIMFQTAGEGKELAHILLLLQELGVRHWIEDPQPDAPDFDVSDL